MSSSLSILQARFIAKPQPRAKTIPVTEKKFTLEGVEVNIINIIKQEQFGAEMIEEICSLKVGGEIALNDSTISRTIKRIG